MGPVVASVRSNSPLASWHWAPLLAVAVAFGVAALQPQTAFAQGEGDAPAVSEDAGAQGEPKSYLRWAYDSLGAGYSIIFLALSFTLVALFVMNVLKASRGNTLPADLIEGFEEHLEQKQYTEAYELASTDESFLGKVLAAGLAKLSGGGQYPQAIEAMQEVGEDENMKLEHSLSYMALIGSISPMIGLLGTVQGMIGAFQEIATTTAGAPKPAALAGEISTALFTTLAGLAVAIPAIAAYAILRNRIARLSLEVGIISEGLMSRFQSKDS